MPLSRLPDIPNSKSNGSDPSDCPGGTVVSNLEILSLSLRIIYTLNSSSQLLLARLKQKSPVIPISKDETPGRADSFGKVLLKTCLAAVCGSSPELLGDPSRDYSIYIVDPLETISGLSVGVGLLSWWLKNDRSPFCNDGEDDNEYAVGKIVMDRGTESLEVVVSLRETTPQSAEDHAKSLFSLRPPSLNRSHTDISDTSSPEKTVSKQSNDRRIGRPAGALTNPEKKARRAALLEQKETLKRLQNLAKMQRGEPYDHTLISSADATALKVTEEDIERQQKVVNDLELRPITSRQTTSLLTTKPLPNRTTNPPTSSVNHPHTGSKQPSCDGSSSAYNTNVKPHGTSSTSQSSASIFPSHTSPSATPDLSAVQNIQVLQTLLTSILGRVDNSSTKPSVKGKEPEPETNIEPAILASLGQLLPFMAARSGFPTHEPNATPPLTLQPSFHQPRVSHHTPMSGFLSSVTRGLFKTADETFCPSNVSSSQLGRHMSDSVDYYGYAKSDPPKVREDAHPVPGGGWARGRNLVPRTPASLITTSSDRPLEKSSADPASSSGAKPGKENKPPSNPSQGIKRGSAALLDKDINFPKSSSKKRKAESKSSQNDVKVFGMKKTNSMVVDAEQNAANNISRATSDPLGPASGQNRTSLSEPDFQGPPAPLIATSNFPIPEIPRTPPPKSKAANLVQKSLSTPTTPVSTIARANGAFNGASLFTPSPVLTRSQEKPNERSMFHSIAIDSQRLAVNPGWDLPPSSPPPPTSPILSPADSNAVDGLKPSGHEPSQNMELAQAFSSPVLLPSSTLSSEFEELSEGGFCGILRSTESLPTDDIELDIDELWESLGPIIVQAQMENTSSSDHPSNDNLSSDYNFSHVVTDSQIDAAKLAEDLKALFGGCVV